MKHSPLQLIRYFVTACACNANPKYDPQKEIVGGLEQFSVEVKATPLEPTKDLPGHHWSVEMAVVQKINEGQNFPYTFHITMEGMYGKFCPSEFPIHVSYHHGRNVCLQGWSFENRSGDSICQGQRQFH